MGLRGGAKGSYVTPGPPGLAALAAAGAGRAAALRPVLRAVRGNDRRLRQQREGRALPARELGDLPVRVGLLRAELVARHAEHHELGVALVQCLHSGVVDLRAASERRDVNDEDHLRTRGPGKTHASALLLRLSA